MLHALSVARGGDGALADVGARSADERYLAAAAGFVDRDGARTLALLEDPSRRVRGVARAVAPLACDDDQARIALVVAWQGRRERSLLRRMSLAGRAAPIDAFLDELASRGADRELVDSLPFGTEACVRRHLTRALERPSARLFRGLAGHHPALLGEVLLERWQRAAGEADPVTRQLTAAHHARIAARAPDAGIALSELLLARGIQPARDVWTAMLRLRAARAVPLAIEFSSFVPDGTLVPRARQLPPALLALAQAGAPALLAPHAGWVRHASPERRAAVAEAWVATHARHPRYGTSLLRWAAPSAARDAAFDAWSRASRDADGVIAPRELAELPRELAEREARRHLADVVALRTRPAERLAGHGRYLPWDELGAHARELLGHPDAALRAVALGELLAVPGVRPDPPELVERALDAVLARRFEQDPVRLTMLSALAAWPRRAWTSAHLPAVGQAVRDMLDASDTSAATAAAAERLVVRLFSVDAEWAGATLGLLVKERGALGDPSLGAKLTDDELARAAPPLASIADAWLRQERFSWIAALATSLGARLASVPGLADTLLRARDRARREWEVTALSRALAQGDPALHLQTLEGHLRRLVTSSMWGAVLTLATEHGARRGERPSDRNRRRDDLPGPLARALIETVTRGPVAQEGPALEALHERAPRAFDGAIEGLLRVDPSLARHHVVRRWLTRHRQDLLGPYLDGTPITGRHATGATGWVFELGDGSFRWEPAQCATFARTVAAIASDPDRDLLVSLRAVAELARLDWHDARELVALSSSDRPAVREKAVRVLSRCDAGQGVPTLLGCLGDDRARFAIYGLRRALFELPADRAVSLIVDAPRTKLTVAKEIIRLLGELRSPRGFDELVRLSETQLHRDARISLLRALWDHLDRDETWRIYGRAARDPDWVTASRLADVPADRLTVETDGKLSALLAVVLTRPEPEARVGLLGRAAQIAVTDRARVLLDAVRARVESPYDDEVRAAVTAWMGRATADDAGALAATLSAPELDPRMLHVAITALTSHDVRARASWETFAAAALDVVARDPRHGALAVRCAGSIARRDTWTATLERLASAGALGADALAEVRVHLGKLPREEGLPLALELARSPHAPVRHAAVTALAHDAERDRGWDDARLALLRALRADADVSVAAAAARVFPPRELDPGW